MLLTTTKPANITDYGQLPEGAPYQLIGGELIMSPSPTRFHQDILSNLNSALRHYVIEHNLGKVYFAPLDVELGEYDVFQPDIIFIRKERLSLIKSDRIDIAPDMVIEILSPSSAYYDYSAKKSKYCEHGVEEYWIVDPEQESIEIMIKDGEYYRTDALLRKPSLLQSQMFPGFSMKLEEVFAL
ncbi:MAG: Uma2 family endonuclease [Ignavibacteriota bacterium]